MDRGGNLLEPTEFLNLCQNMVAERVFNTPNNTTICTFTNVPYTTDVVYAILGKNWNGGHFTQGQTYDCSKTSSAAGTYPVCLYFWLIVDKDGNQTCISYSPSTAWFTLSGTTISGNTPMGYMDLALVVMYHG